MLIRTRRIGENVMIGNGVLGVRGNHVRVAINADKSAALRRQEMTEHILQELSRTVLGDGISR